MNALSITSHKKQIPSSKMNECLCRSKTVSAGLFITVLLSTGSPLFAEPTSEQQDEKDFNQKVADMAAEGSSTVTDNASFKGLSGRWIPNNHRKMPKGGDWFNNAGLGLFIHWGPASAYYGSPWVMRGSMKTGELRKPKTTAVEYYSKIDQFKPDQFNPEKWFKAAADAGFRYVVLTSKHHDGYTLWPSKHSDFGVQQYYDGKDLIGRYVKAVRNNSMKVGFYFSGTDWNLQKKSMNFVHAAKDGTIINYKGEMVDSLPPRSPEMADIKEGHVQELLNNYGKIDLWWWDSGLPIDGKPFLKNNPDIVINNRGNHRGGDLGTYPFSHYGTPEGFRHVEWKYAKKAKELNLKWEVCANSFNRGSGWFYQGRDKSSERLGSLPNTLANLAVVKCWGGNMLLNIKPRPDGTLTDATYEAFAKLGRWMKHSGESLFGVDRYGTHYPEKSNVPITKKENKWYLHHVSSEKDTKLFKASAAKEIVIQGMPQIADVIVLRTGEKPEYSYENETFRMQALPPGPDGLHEVIEVKF